MATITAAAGGGFWNVGSTWVGGVVPLTTDDVVLNGTSGQVTISGNVQCKDINFSGYTNTITFNANLTITGNLTRSTSIFSYLGTGGIIISGTTTQSITTTGSSWDIPITIGGVSPNLSIVDAFTINATLTLSSTTSPIISRLNVFDTTENIEAIGNIVISGNGIYTGSANILVLGSNNQSLTASGSHQIRNNLTINKTGGVLTLSGTLNYNTGTLTYVASGGTVNAGTSTLNIGASTTLNTNGITWNNVTTSGTTTLTLSSNFNITNLTVNSLCNLSFSGTGLSISGNLTMGGVGNGASTFNVPNNLTITNFSTFYQAATNNYTLNGNTISITGNITVNMNNNNGVLGTTTLKMIGTGNLTFSNSSNTNFISNPFTIDTSGTITTVGSGTPFFSSSTITYTSGTITGVGVIFSACTLNLNSGGQWGTDVTIRGTTTLTSNATFGNITTNTTAAAIGGAFNINVKGNLAVNIVTSGAASFEINGTGLQSWTHGSAVYLSNNLTINKSSGTLTIGSVSLPNVYYATGTLTYNNIGGTVDAATNLSILNISSTTTLNTNGINWYKVTVTPSTTTTITLSSDINITNRLTYSYGTISHAGSGLINLTGDLQISSASNFSFNTSLNFNGRNINVVNLEISNNNGLTSATITNSGGIIYVSGNYTLSNGTNNVGGIICSPIVFNGTGTWNHTTTSTQRAFHGGSITINTLGTLTFGNFIYYGIATGTLTYIQGNVDQTTNNNNFNIYGTCSLDISNLTLNNVLYWAFGQLTLLSNLYANTFTVGGANTINGSFDIYCATLNINNSTTGAGGTVTYARNFYCSGNCSVSALKSTATAYILGNCSYANASSAIGFANLYMIGSGTLTAVATNNYTFPSNLYINTPSKIKLVGNFYFGNDTNTVAIINIIRGIIDATKATIILPTAQTHTLTNMNKMLGGNIVINTSSPPVTLIMNEFFCGDATNQTNITTTNSANNAIVTFTDNFEKIAKFVTMNGITFTRPQQLLLLTNQPKKSRNIGIRYNNSLANGVAKNDPSVQNQMAYSVPKYLMGDPNMIKSI